MHVFSSTEWKIAGDEGGIEGGFSTPSEAARVMWERYRERWHDLWVAAASCY